MIWVDNLVRGNPNRVHFCLHQQFCKHVSNILLLWTAEYLSTDCYYNKFHVNSMGLIKKEKALGLSAELHEENKKHKWILRTN